MSEDIHKWTDGKYALMFDEHTFFVFDNEEEKRMTALQVTKKLNGQQATIDKLKSDIEETEISIKLFEDDIVTKDKEIEEQQSTIERLEQRDYYNQSERYKILCRAIELASDFIHTNNLEYYDFCALVTEFEKELFDNG